MREGAALLQGLATCGKCGRRLHTHYRGRNASPGYHCSGKDIVQGRGVYCLNVGGVQIDQAVVEAFLRAVTPAAVEATQLALQQLEADQDAALGQWRLAVERARYEAERAERQYRGRARKQAGGARVGNRMGKTLARSRCCRSRTAAAGTTTPSRTEPR